MHFPSPGEKFEGKYLIETVLGRGGFARVYLATEVGLERPVALKVLMPPNAEDKPGDQHEHWLNSTISRFEREAQILSKLRCAHTVNVYAFGRTEDGLMYMVLEYVEGLNLTELTNRVGALSPPRVVKILRQILLSLQEAHSQGMLHRDIKPANIMVFDHMGVPDNVKLLDFGIAKAVGEMKAKSADLTSDGTLVGTPRYMSPEQIQGEPEVGPPSDVYSLGLVTYELLIGERAITVENSLQVIGQQLAPEPFRLPSTVRIPPRLKAVVNRMLEKNLSKRFQSVDEVLAAIAAPDLLEEDLESLPDITLALEPEPMEEEEAEPRTAKWPMVAVGAFALVVLILFGVNVLRTASTDGEGQAATLPEANVPEPEPMKDAPTEIEPDQIGTAQIVEPPEEDIPIEVEVEPEVLENPKVVTKPKVTRPKVVTKPKVAENPQSETENSAVTQPAPKRPVKKWESSPDSMFPLIE